MNAPSGPGQNQLIAALADRDRQRWLGRLEPVELRLGQVLYESGGAPSHVYFPTTAIVSLLTGNPISKDVAMTGEITLRGRVLPIGGLKEKLLAALRGGIKTVLIPEENEKDLADLPESVKNGLTIVPVSTIDQVLARALVRPLTPVQWTEIDEANYRAELGRGGGAKGAEAPLQH